MSYKPAVWGENGKRRHAKPRQRVTFSCFRMATFRPATRKYATSHALRFRLLFVLSLPGGAKGRHAKTRQNHHLAGFRVATFRVFAPKTRWNDMALINVSYFRPARQRYDKQEAKRWRMKSVVLSRGGAKGRLAKTRKSDHLAGCRVAPFRLYAPKTRLYDMAQISHYNIEIL